MNRKFISSLVMSGALLSASSAFAVDPVLAKVDDLQKQIEELKKQVATNTETTTNNSKSSSVGNYVMLNHGYSERVLNNQNVTDRQLLILKDRQNGTLKSNAFYISGKGEFYISAEQLSGEHDDNTRINLPFANILFTATAGDWLTGYFNMQVSNPITKNIVLDEALLLVGNLNETPFYFYGGQSIIDFGSFDTVQTFVPNLTRAAFMAKGGNIGLGYYGSFGENSNLNVTVTAMNGGGTALVNSKSNDGSNNINNYAANIEFDTLFELKLSKILGEFGAYLGDKHTLNIGGGYINQTGFSSDDSGGRIGALDFNVSLTMHGRDKNETKLALEFVQTLDNVQGLQTNSDLLPHDTNDNSLYPIANILGWTSVSYADAYNGDDTILSYSVELSHSMPIMQRDTVFYASYSEIRQNSDNNQSLVGVGARQNVIDTLWVGLAYNNASGKLGGVKLPSSNLYTLDLTAYF